VVVVVVASKRSQSVGCFSQFKTFFFISFFYFLFYFISFFFFLSGGGKEYDSMGKGGGANMLNKHHPHCQTDDSSRSNKLSCNALNAIHPYMIIHL